MQPLTPTIEFFPLGHVDALLRNSNLTQNVPEAHTSPVQCEVTTTQKHKTPAYMELAVCLGGYVAAEAKVYEFLTLRPAHCSSFRVFDDHSLPAGNSL
ncbi:Mitogen-Activated Protein Kinase Kinase Kinase 19 [Manis pentadactyla]|nr:Mitogen-Activated Protein Kinase Kinase Kinase 19 [Manis pentadactyla]